MREISKLSNICNFLNRENSYFKSSIDRSILPKPYTNFKITANIILFIWLASIPAKNSIYQISTVLLILLGALSHFHNKNNKNDIFHFIKNYFDIIIALSLIIISMVVANIFSQLSNSDSWIALSKFLYRYIFVLFSLLYLFENHVFSKSGLVAYILIGLSFYSITGTYEAITTFGSSASVSSFVYNRNPFGLTMLAGIIVSTITFKKLSRSSSSHRSNLVLILALTFFTIAIIFSQSRSSWLSAATFYLFIAATNWHWILKHKISILCAVIILMVLVVFDQALWHRAISIFNFSEPHRTAIWSNAIQLIKENPLFGYGLVDYRTIGIKRYAGVHNSVLEITLFTGILGLCTFAITAIVTIREILSKKEHELLVGMLALFLISQFNLSILGNKIYLSVSTIFLFFAFSQRKGDTDM